MRVSANICEPKANKTSLVASLMNFSPSYKYE
jgi:hypothetical protein